MGASAGRLHAAGVRQVEVLTLNLAPAPAGLVVPRRLVLRARPGSGRLHLPSAADASWRASAANAWEAACALAGRRDVDAAVELAGPTAVTGGSAGLPLGLAALALLLERPLAPVLATGEVLPGGYLRGGLHAQAKASAAAGIAAQRGWTRAPFIAPPLAVPPRVAGLDVRCATDLGAAFALLDPDGHLLVAERHRALRRQALPAGVASGAVLRDGLWRLCSGGEALWVVPESDAVGASPSALLELARSSAGRR